MLKNCRLARYTFTATDSANPGKSATTLFMLKKPEFYITVSPNPVRPGKLYRTESVLQNRVSSSAKIEITDASGKVLHTLYVTGQFLRLFQLRFPRGHGPGTIHGYGQQPLPESTLQNGYCRLLPEGNSLPVTTVMTPELVSAVPTAVSD